MVRVIFIVKSVHENYIIFEVEDVWANKYTGKLENKNIKPLIFYTHLGRCF